MRNGGNFDHGGEPTSSPGGREFTASETQGPIPALPAARVARSRDTGLNFVGRCQVRCDCEPRGQMASIRAAGMVRRNAFAALKPRPHGRNARHRAPAQKQRVTPMPTRFLLLLLALVLVPDPQHLPPRSSGRLSTRWPWRLREMSGSLPTGSPARTANSSPLRQLGHSAWP
jgi:hypothetical protein